MRTAIWWVCALGAEEAYRQDECGGEKRGLDGRVGGVRRADHGVHPTHSQHGAPLALRVYALSE